MELPRDYPLAVAAALAINIQCCAAAWSVGGARKKIFNTEFLRKEFGAEHKKQLQEQIVMGGYPDMGSGVYSQKLSYKDWYRFNVLQRIHGNYVQNISIITTATLAAGLYQPKTAAYIGVSYMVGRLFYSIFYKRQGGALNKLRMLGSLICLVSLVASVGVFGWSFYNNYWSK